MLKPTRAKPATISLPADLLNTIDTYVKKHKAEGATRSSVVEQGVRLWLQALRDQRDYEYFVKNAKALQADDESWSAIASEAAKEIFK
jgi:metal-responsive CopG/Arc/MetJ family transcriptional regulator